MSTVVSKSARPHKGVGPSKSDLKQAGDLLKAIESGQLAKTSWQTSKEIFDDTFLALRLFRLGLIDYKSARIYLGHLQVAAKLLALNVEFLRLTGQAKQGDEKLRSFKIA